MLYPRYSPPPPEASSKKGQDVMNAVEREMQELYHVAHLRLRGDEYYETREWGGGGVKSLALARGHGIPLLTEP
jgi:hypothetical protein